MDKRLTELLNQRISAGETKEQICERAGISYSSLSHALAPGGIDYALKPEAIYRLAMACGAGRKKALLFASDAVLRLADRKTLWRRIKT
jgi:hypothetical protein